MAIYTLPLILIGFFALLSLLTKQSRHRNVNALCSIIIAVLLVAILSFRDSSIGIDVKGYLNYWAQAGIRDTSETTRFEPMFVKLNELSHSVSSSPHVFLTIVGILSIAPIAFVIYKRSYDPLLSWLIYICLGFYAFTFSGLRQAIAYGLTTLSIYFIQKRKLIPFLLLVGLASTFHFSALIFLPAYLIYWIRLNWVGVAIYFVALIPVFLFRAEIFQWFSTRFYSTYEISTSSSFSWLALSALIVSACWFYFYIAQTKILQPFEIRENSGILQLATVGVSLMLFASVGTNVMRMADYYYVAIIFAIPSTLSTISNPLRILLKTYIGGALLLLYFVQMNDSPYSIVPYSTF